MFTRVVRLRDASDVADVVAHRLLKQVIGLQAAKGEVHLCLTGGITANLMYERFADLAPDSSLDPTALQLWWGDERFVGATDDDRHSLQAVARLARTVALKSAQIHMMPARDGRADSAQAAAEYAAELGGTIFDITLLGVGVDGHVASIFPDHPSSEPTTRSVIGVTNAPAPMERISLSMEAINRSSQVWFMTSGREKADAVARALRGDPSVPASRPEGRDATYWFLDQEAAGELPASYSCLL